MVSGERLLPDEELTRPAAVLAQRFIQRWDLYPLQLNDGRYICLHEQLNVEHLYSHLRGDITLGVYLLNKESHVRFVVLDHDAEDGWDYLGACGQKLTKLGIPVYLEKSRRGGHMWFFFAKPTKGQLARKFAQSIIQSNHFEGFEIYPKQDEVGKGLGSLIRLPFGVHRLTGRRYGFYDQFGEPLGRTLREQISALQTPKFVSAAFLKPQKTISSSKTPEVPPKRLQESTEHVSERIKAQVTVLEFISQYVDLKRTESGAIGLCPFHDDQHPSFGVNDKENYWHCFAGCGGGSIIDFWALWRRKEGMDAAFIPTITELAEMLL